MSAEKIQRKKALLKRTEERIAKDTATAAQLRDEIEKLEAFEIYTTIKRLNLPQEEVKSLLDDLIQSAKERTEKGSENP